MEKILKKDEFYSCLAHLYYAVTVVDKRIEVEEKKRIKDLVEQYWSIDFDYLNGQDIIFSTLKRLFNEKPKSEEAYTVFCNFFNENEALFTDKLKRDILDTSDKIAQSFSGRNKSESVLISRLYFLFKEK
jgi:hypothetical protein